MFNTIAFNRAPFNRYVAGGESFMPSGAAYAETEAIGAIRLIKRMDGSTEAVAVAAAAAGLLSRMSAQAEAEAAALADYIRKRYFFGHADAVAEASALSLYGKGTDVLELEIDLHAGDDLVIDTERMTMLINSRNAIYALSDDSTFFNLQKGDYITITGTGVATITLLWKDRWL